MAQQASWSRSGHLQLTGREAIAVGELLDALLRSLRARLPHELELVELEVELRRAPGSRDHRERRRR